MATHRATCQDCHETYTDSDLLKVSEWAEDHKRTEVHDVHIERAVATDGGQDLQFLGAELHKCDLCDQVFDDVDALAAHDCDPSVERLLPDGGSEMYWDDEHCPRADCEGHLQHQDQVEIMCLACKGEWTAAILRGEHVLIDSDGERVSSESRSGRHE